MVATSVASTHANASAPATDDTARAAAAESAEKAKRSVDAASAMIGSAASTASSVVKQGGAIVGEVGGRIAESAKKMDPKTKKLVGLVVGALLVLGAVGYGAKLMLVPDLEAVIEKNIRAKETADVKAYRETTAYIIDPSDSKLSQVLIRPSRYIATKGGIKNIKTDCPKKTGRIETICATTIEFRNGDIERGIPFNLVKDEGKWLILN